MDWARFDRLKFRCCATGIYRKGHGVDRPLQLVQTAGLRAQPGEGLPPLEPKQEALSALYDQHSQRHIGAMAPSADSAALLSLQQLQVLICQPPHLPDTTLFDGNISSTVVEAVEQCY